MEPNVNSLLIQAKRLSESDKYKEVLELLSDDVLEPFIRKKKSKKKNKIRKRINAKVVELFIRKGYAFYELKEYENALEMYNSAIDLNSDYALAYYNRAFVRIAQEEYDMALTDCDSVLKRDSDYIANVHVVKGSILRAKKEYTQSIEEFDIAIEQDLNYANAYYNRGLAKKEQAVDLAASKADFEKFIELAKNDKDKWIQYAENYIEEIDELSDVGLKNIIEVVNAIKEALLVKEACVTHYTSLSVIKKLILDGSKFRISEGHFMNDPTEGKELLDYLGYNPKMAYNETNPSENFISKPFIGSFVSESKNDDLNMWRFYGKENGEEAKGCSITLCAKQFVSSINASLPFGEGDYAPYDYAPYKSDTHFYRVCYLKDGEVVAEKDRDLKVLMRELKNKVKAYMSGGDAINTRSLDKYINSIAFLFKNHMYQNENEVRLVVQGVEFEKRHDKDLMPPRVYIELDTIKNIVKKITLGPKVDKVNEWASAFHHSYDINTPAIEMSHLPYR